MFDIYNLDKKFRLVYDAISFIDGSNIKSVEMVVDECIDQYELWKDYYEDWRENQGLSRELQGIITEIDMEPTYTNEIKQTNMDNISYEFISLKTDEDILQFAKKYGMLGLLPDFHLGELTLQRTHFEPFELWRSEIKKFTKILKLYRALSTNNEKTENIIEDNIIKVSTDTNFAGWYEIYWYDNTPVRKSFPEQTLHQMSMIDIGRIILSEKLQEYTNGIDLKIDKIIKSEKNKMGFYITEKRETRYLITAIYYDLWDKINSNVPVNICVNPKCQLPFMKIKRQKYCSNACKQETYRLRKGGE
ncbi:hypothetical protein RGU76_03040 [Bacillus pseudomycoides]|uniref:hypothetical protein n=1 Tax=Bacillus pseudomycoides TaxID=64104 RepID=UPI002853535F|nr:hypothetical protein [Bacillus pseudomycoides]MDR4914109.1 hypothetical protein [Bacillus pseudomycoides]